LRGARIWLVQTYGRTGGKPQRRGQQIEMQEKGLSNHVPIFLLKQKKKKKKKV